MRTIFITGVSRGLGQALSKALNDSDTRLIGFGRTQGDFKGEFHSCDFSKAQLASSIFASALKEADLSRASSIVFISNAGTLGPIGKAQQLDTFDIEQTITANLCGSTIAATQFLRATEFLDVPKLFIQISSGAALPDRAKGSWSLYCACKAGQEQLVRAIAIEQDAADYPSRFININPGVMETAMQVAIRKLSPDDFPEVQEFIKMKEEGRVPSPDTIAERIKDLISDISSLENGKTYTLANYKK
ncbi:SDR family NAD(P)-dependent oxidoreductase [Pelagicoccus sp. SDUM812003]|uniref:SDR family NAD(P)-dependent oxidoreductase n=1 Tax=Pelagicoccus sp. SDUM812003 TaxID=3041267 RepID=UPI00280E27E8|nr:SDR family NAD(P)-dependent oxidoreductase [Pelagicoccus sp. SDUM812003]MDQ8203718.1 SDR family NAD(P)-dependent oxidoreductase [Pelagicoccus sp. SDUM812003]